MTMQWWEEMAVDHGLIDHDHQVLIKIINEFCAVAPELRGHRTKL